MINFQKNIFRPFGQAIADYHLVSENDRVLICLSGGADSFTLAELFLRWQVRLPFSILLYAVHVDLWENAECRKSVEDYAGERNLSLKISLAPRSEIEQKIADSPGFSPCYICARERRLKIFKAAVEFNCNKIAFAHNLNDFFETTLLNMFYSGSFEALSVKKLFCRGKFLVIRPLVFIESAAIRRFINVKRVTVHKNSCPYSESTKREVVRRVIARQMKTNPYCLGSFRNGLKKWLGRS
ncbi:MAG: ATP-binding protein [Candidatus Wallbacteria bacterium]|nr:ATP-binding protein [Candidatus Wallbacteria bacterium]